MISQGEARTLISIESTSLSTFSNLGRADKHIMQVFYEGLFATVFAQQQMPWVLYNVNNLEQLMYPVIIKTLAYASLWCQLLD